jgi:hypothetical protein
MQSELHESRTDCEKEWLLRNSLNRFKITLSNTLLIELRRLIGRKFEGSESSLLGFGIGVTFACLHFVGKKYDNFRTTIEKVGQKYKGLTRKILQQRIAVPQSSHDIPDFPWRRISRGIGVETTALQH